MVIEKGTIKVVWITKNVRRIYSKMFDDAESAKIFGESKKNYLIFRLVWRKGFKEFSWVLLPYGQHKIYEKALQFYQKHKGKNIMKIFNF